MRNNLYLIILLLAIIVSCSTGKKKQEQTTSKDTSRKTDLFSVKEPINNQLYTIGDTINIQVIPKPGTPSADSLIYYTDNEVIMKCAGDILSCPVLTNDMPVGMHRLKIKYFAHDTLTETEHLSFRLKSDTKPSNYRLKVINTYPHDKNAYTQGLVYENGCLYESTGRNGQSSLRKVELKTGKVLQSYQLENKYFGEGIALFDNKIVQLTYKAQKAFVYRKEDFKKVSSFSYPNPEGWGLTYDGKQLIMSDGSHRLFFYDINNFTQVRSIEVYDHLGPVDRLNELEYIKNSIYANIYGKNYIVIIDPATGKVTGKIDCNGLLDNKDYHTGIDVLNGIAYNPGTGRLYVTGKNWPKLFDIQLVYED